MGFVTPEEVWMRETLSPFILDLFRSERFRARPYWDAEKVLRNYQVFFGGKSVYSPEIWRIVCTELWLRKFFDPKNESAEPCIS